jgi:hypothetical protein
MSTAKRLNYPRDCASLRDEIRELLTCVRDNGTSADGGGGMGRADLWATVQGVEYFITVQKSNAQLRREEEQGCSQ